MVREKFKIIFLISVKNKQDTASSELGIIVTYSVVGKFRVRSREDEE